MQNAIEQYDSSSSLQAIIEVNHALMLNNQLDIDNDTAKKVDGHWCLTIFELNEAKYR